MARELAAYYVGLSVNTFDSRVKAGGYPKGIRIGGRLVWDRVALDQALDADIALVAKSPVEADKAELDRRYGNGSP